MKSSKFTESQIIKALKENENGKRPNKSAGSWVLTKPPLQLAQAVWRHGSVTTQRA
ncbi:MAG: hypothetical protein IPN10_03700 [Saprospiraceae bacterium]|nr:hypothetical protein [Saprospiraceae bacterium]